jgi:hypothetical protein
MAKRAEWHIDFVRIGNSADFRAPLCTVLAVKEIRFFTH